ncbi:MAG: hypothetical protein AAF355_04515 [Myxococcota bacterium]
MSSDLPKLSPKEEQAFLDALVASDRITQESADRVRRLQTKGQHQFGRVAMRMKLLTPRQISDALAYQSEYPTLRIGECARSRGFLRKVDIEAVLAEQQQSRQSLLTLLIEDFVLAGSEVEREVNLFLEAQERLDEENPPPDQEAV